MTISIHALLAESDERANSFPHAPPQISIHALLAESDIEVNNPVAALTSISIHALLAESDCIIDIINNIIDNFYPRSPCGERRTGPASFRACIIFLSTLSLRRATRNGLAMRWNTCISIHALLAESDRSADCNCRSARPISIHALLAESDHRRLIFFEQAEEFLSTLSLRRATQISMLNRPNGKISIHALLAESDDTPSISTPKPGISIHALLAESDWHH